MRYLVCMLILSLPVTALNAGEHEFKETMAGLKYRDAIVKISNFCSAVCVSPDGIYLSANHCRYEVNKTYQTSSGVEVKCIYNTNRFDGVTVFTETSKPSEDRVYLPIASDKPAIGDVCYAIGYPAGKFSYHEAKVKAAQINQRDGNEYFTIDQRLWEGHSGGPLINSEDQVMGILSTRSQLQDEPEANFIGLDAIYVALKDCGFFLQKVSPTVANPTIVVFTQQGCIPCENLKRDYYSGKFPSNYRFVFVEKKNGVWDKSDYVIQYQKQLGTGSPSRFPTVWVQGTKKTQIGYAGAISLISFIRDAIKFLVGIIFGGEDSGSSGNVPRIDPLPPNPGDTQDDGRLSGLLEKYYEIKSLVDGLKGRLEKVNEVESRVTELVQRYMEIKPKIEIALELINELRSGKGIDLSKVTELAKQLETVDGKVGDLAKKFNDTKDTVEEAKQTIEEVKSSGVVQDVKDSNLLSNPLMIFGMVASGLAGLVVKRKLA